MDLLIPILIALLLRGLKWNKTGYNEDYISKEQTNAINGFFVILIFVRHFFQYIECERMDVLLYGFNKAIGQLIVVSFLFYSGYAAMYQIDKRGRQYIDSMLFNRIFKTWFRFSIVVVFFLLINLLMKKNISFKSIVLALIGLESIGNSTWYVVAIICLWLFTYVAFGYLKNRALSFGAMIVFMGIYSVVFAMLKTQTWFNTIICYLLGMLFFVYKEYLLTFLKKRINYYICFLGGLVIVIFGSLHQSNFLIYEIWVSVFCLLLILITLKCRIRNIVLDYLGKYSFEIYIIQRIPMMLFEKVIDNNLLFFCVSLLVTFCLAIVFEKFFSLLEKMICERN